MNKKRRKEIEDVRKSLRKVYEELEELKDEEQEAFDNLPESFQESEKGERMQEYIEYTLDLHPRITDKIERINL